MADRRPPIKTEAGRRRGSPGRAEAALPRATSGIKTQTQTWTYAYRPEIFSLLNDQDPCFQSLFLTLKT